MRRQCAIACFVARLAPGASITAAEVVAGCGLRLTHGQRRGIGAALLALGMVPEGNGPARRYVRRGEA